MKAQNLSSIQTMVHLRPVKYDWWKYYHQSYVHTSAADTLGDGGDGDDDGNGD